MGSPMAPEYGTSFDSMEGPAMNPMDSLRSHQAFGTQFQSNPAGGAGPSWMHRFGTGPMNYGD